MENEKEENGSEGTETPSEAVTPETEKVAEKTEEPVSEDAEEPEEVQDSETEGRAMYKATCADCGEECEVPFEPTEGKPVRCQDCFRRYRSQRRPSNRRFDNRRFDRGPREMHKAVCSDCNKECEVPFRPTEGKPVYCRDCFMKRKDRE